MLVLDPPALDELDDDELLDDDESDEPDELDELDDPDEPDEEAAGADAVVLERLSVL
ncbi:hypothetical protein ACFJIY_07805 [Pimelobacter simplex]|uniref:hypothetical protein n=1 Tax=Nocardioides simplex TaxID=2045 RepID=UPI00366A979F